MKLTIENQTFVGTPEKIIECLEAAGYAAIGAENNPHYYWQQGEYIKREMGGAKVNTRRGKQNVNWRAKPKFRYE